MLSDAARAEQADGAGAGLLYPNRIVRSFAKGSKPTRR
jgi:hypothetical protein